MVVATVIGDDGNGVGGDVDGGDGGDNRRINVQCGQINAPCAWCEACMSIDSGFAEHGGVYAARNK